MRGRPAAARGYDAFLSYSHAADGALAPAIQRSLEALAKPLYQRRALRVFRDKTSLAVTPALWPTIQQALAASRYFVLLASPAAAQSPWVQQEVAWWMQHRQPDTSTFVSPIAGGKPARRSAVTTCAASSSIQATVDRMGRTGRLPSARGPSGRSGRSGQRTG